MDACAEIDAAGARLAPAHATALRLEARGACSDDIARVLGIPPEAVAPLLEIARAKLARLRARPVPGRAERSTPPGPSAG